jgi:hypothetical protein
LRGALLDADQPEEGAVARFGGVVELVNIRLEPP